VNLRLSLGMSTNPRTRPVFEKQVSADGIDLVPTHVHVAELFWRQLRSAEFDVAEMSMSTLMMAIAQGDDRFVGLPIFTTRRMFHTAMLARKDAGINSPADLKGKRVGVPEYQQTSALWTRGVLKHHFGVEDRDMEHWMDRQPAHSHRGEVGFTPPKGVIIHQVPGDTDIGEMLLQGRLDAVMSYNPAKGDSALDRGAIDLANHPDVKHVFPDKYAEAMRFKKVWDLYPINHGMVIKREIAEKHPWAVLNIYKAFEKANEIAEAQRMEHTEYHIEAGLLPAEAKKALATQVLYHGVRRNRTSLEMAAQLSFEQGLTPRLMKLEELFAPSTMEQ
jgi:4,5-dihydroxyphthalate decarboxylase